MQYTLRDIPPPVDAELRRRAKAEGKSLNAVAIEILIRGLGWAVKEFEKALPRIPREDVRYLIQGMRDRHLRSIAACKALVRAP